MIKFISVALYVVLVISCATHVYGGVQHVRSESVKEDQAATKVPITPSKEPINPTKEPIAPTKEPITPTKEPITPTKEPITPTKEPITPTKEPITPTKAPIPSTKVTTTATTAKPTPPHCQTGDRKVVEHSCKEYLECDNQYNWVIKTCSTMCKVFEPKSAKCVWNWQFPCMKPPTTVAPPPSPTDNPTKGSTDSPTKAPVTPTTNAPECKEGNVKPIEGNCKDYFTCKSNKWVQTSCSLGYDFDINKHTCVWSWWAKC